MEVQISTHDLIGEIRDVFIAELTAIPEDTYTKTGSPVSEGEFEKALVFADTAIRQSAERWLVPHVPGVTSPSNTLPGTLVYIFRGTERRFGGKVYYLADMIQEALKESALSRLFSTIDGDLSGKHIASASEVISNIGTSLFTKLPPHRSYR